MSVITLSKNNFEEIAVNSDKPVLIDFWAPWCGPCKMLSPVVDSIAEEYTDIKVCKVNVDDEGELAIRFGVMSIPTLVVMNNGEETNRSVGVISRQEILDMVK